MAFEFSDGATVDELFIRADELGFTGFVLNAPDIKVPSYYERESSDRNELAILELQNNLSRLKVASAQVYLTPVPGVHWILNFKIQDGLVKSVEKAEVNLSNHV
jgi:hypothetical protein